MLGPGGVHGVLTPRRGRARDAPLPAERAGHAPPAVRCVFPVSWSRRWRKRGAHTGGAQGQAADIAIVAKEILKTREKLNKIYVSHTGKDVEAIERVMDRDTYFTAEEAKEFGVVDEVVAARERPGKPSEDDEEPLERAA